VRGRAHHPCSHGHPLRRGGSQSNSDTFRVVGPADSPGRSASARAGTVALDAYRDGYRRVPLRCAGPGRGTRAAGRRLAVAGGGGALMIRRRRWHRIAFIAAGCYNAAWGMYTAADPQWLFRFAGMEPLNHPAIFACLGMVIGLYGILYWEV